MPLLQKRSSTGEGNLDGDEDGDENEEEDEDDDSGSEEYDSDDSDTWEAAPGKNLVEQMLFVE